MSSGLLLERYEVVRVVARGGEGCLYESRDVATGQKVAVKVSEVRDERDRARLEDEAQLLRHLRPHPGLPVVREAVVDGRHAYLATEWVKGRNLAERADTGLGVDEILDIATRVAWALDHLHAHDPSIVHGDVKPRNVLLTPDLGVVLVDFGHSHRVGSPSRGRGTWGYAAPEVLRGVPDGPAADVYGLAATTHALLAGFPPRVGVRTRWVGMDRLQARRVDAAMRAGLAADPRGRPSASAFVDILRPVRRAYATPAPTNVPSAIGPLRGRRSALAAVSSALQRARLVTVTGLGGIGKTRLVEEVARRAARRHPDGVWLCPLGGLDDPGGVALAVARAAGVEIPDPVTPDRLAAALGDRRILLVLDACEHVLDGCARVCESVIGRCPDVRVLAASRSALDVPGEVVVGLEPLGEAGVELFWDACRRVAPQRSRRGADARAVVQLCRRLGGIPLAIELAAARCADTSPVEMLQSPDLGEGDVAAMVAWSEAGLDPGSVELFRRLSILPGGCRADAAIAFCSGDEPRPQDAQRVLWRLVRLGLVVTHESGGGVRYTMPDPVREYGLRRLEELGGRDRARVALVAWALGLSRSVRSGVRDPELTLLHVLEPEDLNLRAALVAAIEDGDPAAVEIGACLGRFWARRGAPTDGARLVDEALALGGPDWSDGRAACLAASSMLAARAGRIHESRTRVEELLAEAKRASDHDWTAWSLTRIAEHHMAEGEPEVARRLYEELAEHGRRHGDRHAQAAAMNGMGTICAWRGDPQGALALLGSAAEAFSACGDPKRAAATHTSMANIVLYNLGDATEAVRHAREAVRLSAELGDRDEAMAPRLVLGLALAWDGNLDEAEPVLAGVVERFRRLGDPLRESIALHHLGVTAVERGDLRTAERSLTRALSLRERTDEWSGPASIRRSLTTLYRLRGDIPRAATVCRQAVEQHQRFGFPLVEDAVTCLSEAALTLAAAGDLDAARALASFVDGQIAAGRAALIPSRRAEHDEVIERLGQAADVPDLTEAAVVAERALDRLSSGPSPARATG